jgi:hypothetical protein
MNTKIFQYILWTIFIFIVLWIFFLFTWKDNKNFPIILKKLTTHTWFLKDSGSWKIDKTTKIDNDIFVWEKQININNITSNDTPLLQLWGEKYLSNIYNLIEIFWENKHKVKNIEIGTQVLDMKNLNQKYFIIVEKWKIMDWEYTPIFHLYDNSVIQWTQKIIFWWPKDKEVFISNVAPNNLQNNQNRNIVIQWEWLNKIISLQLSNNIVIQKTEFKLINNNVMSVVIPKWIEEWKYEINVMTIHGIYNSQLFLEIFK